MVCNIMMGNSSLARAGMDVFIDYTANDHLESNVDDGLCYTKSGLSQKVETLILVTGMAT